MKINLGCARNLMEGYVNVDICPFNDTVIKADLKETFPFEDNTVEEVVAHDIIEHLPDKIHTMNEIWRVCKNKAIVDVWVPTTDMRGAFMDPTHISFWNRNSFFYFTAGNIHWIRFKDIYGIKCGFNVLKEETIVDPDLSIALLKICLQAVKE